MQKKTVIFRSVVENSTGIVIGHGQSFNIILCVTVSQLACIYWRTIYTKQSRFCAIEHQTSAFVLFAEH